MGRYLFGGSSLSRVLDGECDERLTHHCGPYPGDWAYESEPSVKIFGQLVLQKKGGSRKIGTQRVTDGEGIQFPFLPYEALDRERHLECRRGLLELDQHPTE